MKEIGGYFGLEQFTGKEYYPELIALNNARSCLLYLLRARNIKKLYIPYFLCDSVTDLCEREGYAYDFYPIDKEFLPVFDRTLAADEWLYIVNFYGQISNEKILQLQQTWGNVIFDNVQAFFQKPAAGVDTIYSCRKFFGVPDGGYLATDVRLREEPEQDISMDRMKHVLGRFEHTASEYYAHFRQTDESYADLPMLTMSKLTRNLLCAIDYRTACQKRDENYAFLAAALGEYNPLKLTAPAGAYCYPFYCKNGMELKRRLAEQKIYVPTLWPNVLERPESVEKDYAENILPLPCDQRYGQADMKRMVTAIQKYL